MNCADWTPFIELAKYTVTAVAIVVKYTVTAVAIVVALFIFGKYK